MIYISSSCVRSNRISDAVSKIAGAGFSHIELSGGTRLYPELETDLLQLKDEFGLDYLCHNYFPPPEVDFVVNLASLNEEVHRLSMEHARNSIRLSEKLGALQFGIHAGFLMDIPVREIGKRISQTGLFDRDKAWKRFVGSVRELSDFAGSKGLKLYIENNVFSAANYESFKGENLFFLCDVSDAERLLAEVPEAGILADMAHLYVSCKTMGLDFRKEAVWFMSNSNYIHLSGNDGKADTNGKLEANHEILSAGSFPADGIYTLEVYSGLQDVRTSFTLLTEQLK